MAVSCSHEGLNRWIDEVATINSIVQEAAGEEGEMIFGAVHDANLEGSIRVTVIATGFGEPDAQPDPRCLPALSPGAPPGARTGAARGAPRRGQGASRRPDRGAAQPGCGAAVRHGGGHPEIGGAVCARAPAPRAFRRHALRPCRHRGETVPRLCG